MSKSLLHIDNYNQLITSLETLAITLYTQSWPKPLLSWENMSKIGRDTWRAKAIELTKEYSFVPD